MDSHLFKNGMRRLAGAVCIIATSALEKRWGLTATAVCSLSAEPPRLLACVNRNGATLASITDSRRFSANVLGAQHQALAEAFARPPASPTADRFAQGHWTEMTTGAPILADGVVSFDCTVAAIIDTGSHGIVVGDVVDVGINDAPAAALLYASGQFVTLDQPAH